MINYLTLPSKLKKFGHPPVEWLPKDYWPKEMGGGGRTTHDDWAIPFLRNIKRIDTAYAIPLPFRKVAGNGEPVWMPMRNPDYPLAPGAETKVAPFDFGEGVKEYRWVKTMMSIHPAGFWSRQEAYINGEWTECWYTRSVNIFGSRWTWYDGLKLDQDGPMCWFPEASASIKWGYLG